MKLRFEKERNSKAVAVRVLVDYKNIGRIVLNGDDDWKVNVAFKSRAYISHWPSLDQAQNEVRRIIGK